MVTRSSWPSTTRSPTSFCSRSAFTTRGSRLKMRLESRRTMMSHRESRRKLQRCWASRGLPTSATLRAAGVGRRSRPLPSGCSTTENIFRLRRLSSTHPRQILRGRLLVQHSSRSSSTSSLSFWCAQQASSAGSSRTSHRKTTRQTRGRTAYNSMCWARLEATSAVSYTSGLGFHSCT